MRTSFRILFAFLLLTSVSIGQTKQSEQLETLSTLYYNRQYNEVINYKPKAGEELEGKSLYYIGMAYYMKEDDENALKYLDMALKKGPEDGDMNYYKGMLYYYSKNYDKALTLFNRALTFLNTEPDYYGSKGDLFIAINQPDSALANLKKATALENCKSRYFILIGEVLSYQNKPAEALVAYKTALTKIDQVQEEQEYKNCLYNIGMMQSMSGDTAGSLVTYEKYVSEFPTDYHSVAKLIQACYANHQYDKAKTYKQILYKAHAKDSLPENMTKSFCFDQFMWKGKRIMAFENYDEPDVYMYVKHNFYVLNDSGKVAYRIQSESDAMLHKEHPDKLYVLCLVNGEGYHTYWNFTFNDDVYYPDLKSAVLNILNGNSHPEAATIINK